MDAPKHTRWPDYASFRIPMDAPKHTRWPDYASFRLFLSCSSASSNFRIFPAMFSRSADLISLLERANICAANFATLAGLTMKAFDEPGGLVRQVLFMPSGGQETTGKLAKYDAVPDNASVPPAHPTI